MTLKSILALTDFSTSAEHALDRAALMAVRHRAMLRIMYADEVPRLRFTDPFARLQQRARQLARRHGIAAEALDHGGDMLDAIVRHAGHADLLVLDHRQHRATHTFWRGTTLDQLLRHCPCPVLIVKQAPAGPYDHILVAVDFTSESKKLVRYSSTLESESELELFHALNTFNEPGMRSDGGSAEAIKAYRQAALQDAQDRLVRFSDSLDTRRNRASLAAGRAEPARQIAVHQDFIRPDLVLVGKRRSSTLVDFMFGSVARRLISLAGCDVLVVCHDYQAPSGAAAKGRMQSLLKDEASRMQVARRRAV
jgi:nucleotide-binding universal stress UspA family protein